MENLMETVSIGLLRRGFARRDQNNWVNENMTVKFRPEDNSFQSFWTDGQMQEVIFYDFGADPEKNYYQFIFLMQWSEERQKMNRDNQERKAA